ncbi:hypothetical protein B0O80DRAFT_422875 [Mortierella sp. GBAus27b]|nr:hypothetical protein B0O80DRAFT_422875 [Mortierella sp. GBAus27b]
MSEVTTLLAWLIPCLVIVSAFIAWRIYVYKTRGPFVPSFLRRNVFARTNSFLARTPSFSSNKDVATGRPNATPATAIRNETVIDMSRQQQQPMSSIPKGPEPLQTPPSDPPATQEPIEPPKQPISPAVTRLLSMK